MAVGSTPSQLPSPSHPPPQSSLLDAAASKSALLPAELDPLLSGCTAPSTSPPPPPPPALSSCAAAQDRAQRPALRPKAAGLEGKVLLLNTLPLGVLLNTLPLGPPSVIASRWTTRPGTDRCPQCALGPGPFAVSSRPKTLLCVCVCVCAAQPREGAQARQQVRRRRRRQSTAFGPGDGE